MRRIRGGIDPGVRRGAFVILVDGVPDEMYLFPMKECTAKEKPDVDEDALIAIFKYLDEKYKEDDLLITIEDPHAFQQGGASSNFNFGGICRGIRMSLKTLGIQVKLVNPIKWQNYICKDISSIYDKDGKKDRKAMALMAAKKLFPNVDLYDHSHIITSRTKEHDGIVDALLIAEYGNKNF